MLDMKPPTTWHPQLDNPNFLGWTVVAAYGLAGIACAWVALRAGRIDPEGSRIWWFMSAVLLFLGINKQLNLQTLMIIMGRRAAYAGGWYQRRRLVQAIFSVIFALLGISFLAYFSARGKRFIEKHRPAFAGVIVLLFFVVLRASTINHAHKLIGVELRDEQWGWMLEICGSFLILCSAITAAKSTSRA